MKRFLNICGHLVVLLVLVGAAYLLYARLRHYTLAQFRHAFLAISPWSFVAAGVLTALNYLILVGYDWFAVRWVGQKDLPLRKIALASFAGYAFSYNFGATVFGTSIRYRLYSAWGMPLLKILELLVILGLTFWFGLFTLAGIVFIVAPLAIPPHMAHALARWHLSFTNTYWFGVCLLAVAVGYTLLTAIHRKPFRLFRWRLPLPPLKLTLYQIAIACGDLLVAAAVLFALMPSIEGGYLHVLAVFMLAFTTAVLSHVPGGYGVFEATVVFFSDDKDRLAVAAALLAFRMVYYWLPLAIAAFVLSSNELVIGREAPAPLLERNRPPESG